MSDRFAEIKIASIYLSSNGLITGDKAKCRLEGGVKFSSNYASTHLLAADGTVHTQTVQLNKGKSFIVVADYLPESVTISIINALETVVASGNNAAVEVVDFPSFTVNARPEYQNGSFYTREGRSGGILKNVRFFFISV